MQISDEGLAALKKQTEENEKKAKEGNTEEDRIKEEIEKTNRPFTSHEIKSVIKENPSKKRERPEPDSITGEF